MVNILKSIFGSGKVSGHLGGAADLTLIVPSGPDGEAMICTAKDYQGAKDKTTGQH